MSLPESSNSEDAMQFKILRASTTLGPRLGRLIVNGRNSIETPHYVGTTSRGVIPHLSPDMVKQHTALKGVYVALEDFIERASLQQTPPVLSREPRNRDTALRKFIAIPEEQLLILGARRTPPVTSPWSNSNAGVSISTAFGFGNIKAEDYAEAVSTLKPDIIVALGDIPHGDKAGWRRIERMGLRTERWLKDIIYPATEEEDHEGAESAGNVFAPVLPITLEQQSLYLDMLASDWREKIAGLTIYDADAVPELPETLKGLPKLSLSEPSSPWKTLREISLGLDIFTLPFLSMATDAGVALDFRFPPPKHVGAEGGRIPLGSDLSSPENSTDLSPLMVGCDCYACSVHHRAYVRHLLSAKEMLAWVLLQIHNIRVVDAFFAGVRDSIAQGRYDEDLKVFLKTYEEELPSKSGLGPRVRGYQFKSEGPHETKKNPKAFNTLDDAKERSAEAMLPDAETNSEQLENQGFAKTVDAAGNGS